jgi:hypothetical protein
MREAPESVGADIFTVKFEWILRKNDGWVFNIEWQKRFILTGP